MQNFGNEKIKHSEEIERILFKERKVSLLMIALYLGMTMSTYLAILI